MSRYELYIIDDRFANYFYGREKMFFNLFQEYENARGRLKNILARQVEYITKPIPALKIHKLLIQLLQTRSDFYIHNGDYYIENRTGLAKLTLEERKLIIESTGNMDCELTFLEILRKSEFNFYAVEIERNQYGWVRPFRIKKFVQKENTIGH